MHMNPFHKKLSLFLVFSLLILITNNANTGMSPFATGIKKIPNGANTNYLVDFTAAQQDVLNAFAAMRGGDKLAYELRNGTNKVLEAVKSNGNLTIEVWPGTTLTENQQIIQTAMYALGPGDVLQFHQGAYGRLLRLTDGSGIYPTFSGALGKPIVIKGYGNGEERPVITKDSDKGDLWTINGSYIEVSYLEFKDANSWAVGFTRTRKTAEDVGTITNITIRDCVFDNSADCSIAANTSYYHYNNILIENNIFVKSNHEFIYIGQHNGRAWGSNITIRNNFFVGNDFEHSYAIGYAIQFKRNICNSLIENNLILNMRGPGIAVYGTDDTGYPAPNDIVKPIVIRNNLVLGSGEGINTLGGPVRVYDNVAFACKDVGMFVQDRYDDATAVRRDMDIRRNTSGFNGYDLQNSTKAADYSNLGQGSKVITDLGTGSTVTDNKYYGKDATAENVLIQRYVNTLRNMRAKPATFNAYFSDIAGNPGPYTLSQLAVKLRILVPGPVH